MKKTLAILLALLMVGSIVFVACDGGRTPVGDSFDDEDNDYIGEDDESESGSEIDSESESESQQGGNNNEDNYGWTETNDTVYAGVNLNLRENTTTTSDKLATIPYGAALSRAETNGEWDKVTYNGQTGYVKHLYVASSGASFDFTAAEGTPSITVNPQNVNNVIFYQSPFVISNSDKASENWLCASGIKPANIVGEYTLKKLGVSANGDWVKVEFKGKIEISSNNKVDYSENAEIFYIQAGCFRDGRIVDSTWSSGSGGGGLG